MRKYIVTVAIATAFVVACNAGTPTSQVPLILLGEDAIMAPGDTILVGDPAVLISFTNVVSDSRCPTSVTCIQAGSARVQLRASTSAGSRDVFVETQASQDTTSVDSYRVQLRGVTPVPATTTPIPAATYRATVRVTRK